MDEEALIASVLRLRVNGESVAQVHAMLESEGADVTLPQVKKACSKASKRTGSTAPPAAAAVAAAPAADAASEDKKAAKKAKAAAAALKAAESAMLDTQRRLKLAKDPDEMNAQVPRHQMEAFIQRQTKLAVSGLLGPGDANVLKDRIEADIAMLEWLKLMCASGELSFKEDIMALGGDLQLARLKEASRTPQKPWRPTSLAANLLHCAAQPLSATAPPGARGAQPTRGARLLRRREPGHCGRRWQCELRRR